MIKNETPFYKNARAELSGHSITQSAGLLTEVAAFKWTVKMVQGTTKGLQSKAPSNRQKTPTLKKGKKYIAPKKPALVKQAAMQKVSHKCKSASWGSQ